MGHRYNLMRESAFREKGRDWRNLIVAWEFTRMSAPWVLGAAVVGGLGWLAYDAWHAITTATAHAHNAAVPVTSAVSLGAVPAWLWIAAGAVVLGAVAVFRPGQIMTPRRQRLRLVHGFVLLIAFAGVVGLGLSTMTT
jgi:hypothetical protein